MCSPRTHTNGSLAGTPLLHYEDTPYSWHWPDWPTFLAAVGIDGIDDATKGPRFSRGLILNAVREGKGVALTCTSVANDDLAAGHLVRPVTERMTTDNGYWLLTPRDKLDRPEIMAFRAWLLDEIATRLGGHRSPPTPRHARTIRAHAADCGFFPDVRATPARQILWEDDVRYGNERHGQFRFPTVQGKGTGALGSIRPPSRGCPVT